MAVTWTVSTLDTQVTDGSLSDVVQTIHWRAQDSETVGTGDSAVVHYGSSYGSISIAAPDPSSFIPYADITETNAITWAKATLGSDTVTNIESGIAGQITESKTPTRKSGVPW